MCQGIALLLTKNKSPDSPDPNVRTSLCSRLFWSVYTKCAWVVPTGNFPCNVTFFPWKWKHVSIIQQQTIYGVTNVNVVTAVNGLMVNILSMGSIQVRRRVVKLDIWGKNWKNWNLNELIYWKTYCRQKIKCYIFRCDCATSVNFYYCWSCALSLFLTSAFYRKILFS